MNPSCKQYFQSNSEVRPKLNMVPVYGDTVSGYHFETWNPFLIIGLWSLNSGAMPNGAEGDAVYGFRALADETLFPWMELHQNMMCANRDGMNQSGFLAYAKNNPGADFSRYFMKMLQEELMPINFGPFMSPMLFVKRFWEDEQVYAGVAGYDAHQETRLMDVASKLFDLTDLRLWLAPGKYTMVGADMIINDDAYFAPFDSVMTGSVNGDLGLITVELKSIE